MTVMLLEFGTGAKGQRVQRVFGIVSHCVEKFNIGLAV